MFLDPSDFEDAPYIIPNQEESRSLQDFIDKKEAEYLKKVLGLSLYNDFIAGLETSGDIEQIWLDLRDGADYTESDVLYNYCGVKELLKPAIYSDWITINYRKWSNGGMIVNDGQNNTTAVNPSDEIVTAWNDFVTKLGSGCWGWSYQNTFRGFMNINGESYENWSEANSYPFRLRNTLDL